MHAAWECEGPDLCVLLTPRCYPLHRIARTPRPRRARAPSRKVRAKRLPRFAVFSALCVSLLGVTGVPDARARGSLRKVENEFREAIGKVAPAAVVCVATGISADQTGLGSSGVIVTPSGYVLSDGDAGAYVREGVRTYSDQVDVKVPDLEEGGFRSYEAEVVRRVRSVDTCLLRIREPPRRGFANFIRPASAAHLQVGDFTFATGNAYGGRETPPATTAGIVASLTYLPLGDAGGRFEHVFTSAAVNPGVNGGPVVDVEGRLVGTVSTFLTPAPGQPYQFLGRVVPMDRIGAVFSDLAEAEEIFPPLPSTGKDRAPEAAALEAVFRHAGHRAYPSVVSLEVERSTPLSTQSPGMRSRPNDPAVFPVPRYLGPFTGVLVDREGWIVTSLANLTNVASLVFQGWSPVPPDAQIETGLRAVTSLTVHFPDGRAVPARIAGHDPRLGIALLEADLPEGGSATGSPVTLLEAAPPETFVEGRFVVAVGNPFGKEGNPDPLLAVGVLSKYHAESAPGAWRGQWQTDAAATDANCGGAVVDLNGRMLGLLQVWSPLMFGRNSGVGFIVPWERITASLPFLKEGRKRAFLGVGWQEGTERATVARIVPNSAAAKAGLEAGDTIVGIDDRDIPTRAAFADELAARWSGEKVRLRVERGRKVLDFDLELGERSRAE